MNFSNLKRNDVIFCESKGSRVIKLTEQNENLWVGKDLFTNQHFEISSTDSFKLVNRAKKTKPLSLLSLVESENPSSTLTEKEVIIVDYLIETYSHEEMNKLIGDYKEAINVQYPNSINIFKSISNYLNLKKGINYSEMFQYLICASENIGKPITTSTTITRFLQYTLSFMEHRLQHEYISYTIDFSALNQEDAEKISEVMQNDNIWDYDPESHDSEYGDSDVIDVYDFNTHLDSPTPLIID